MKTAPLKIKGRGTRKLQILNASPTRLDIFR